VDRWDIAAVAGVALVGGGLWGLWGWPWSAIFAGAVVLTLCVVRELRR
jgi:hypothetical protein